MNVPKLGTVVPALGRSSYPTRWLVGGITVLLLTACGSIHTKAPGWAAPMRPPAELTAEVPEPVLPEDANNGALAEFASDLQAALREANRRLRAIRGL